MSHCIVGVGAVKNEADVIEAHVRHNLRYLDRMIVLDHDSCDATPRILQSLVDEGLPLTVSRLGVSEPAFKQAQFTTALARGAFEKCAADWVIPLDADEFVRAPSRDALEAALNGITADVASLRWETYVPSPEGQPGHPLRSLRWRVDTAKEPLSKVVLSRRVLERDWRIGRGNHVVFEQAGDVLSWTVGETLQGITLAHLPLRSPEQLAAKALVGWSSRRLTYGQKAATTANSWHLRELFARIATGEKVTARDVHDYAVGIYALGQLPSAADAGQFSLVEDQVAEAMPLRYTEGAPIDVVRQLAVWVSQMLDSLVQPADASPSSEAPARE
jgi:hypothetical protein